MRCFNCNKNFDYDKYYGICPKCGCYNKKESSQEQQQQYENTGYEKKKSPKKGNAFLAFSIVFFVVCMVVSVLLPLITAGSTVESEMTGEEQVTVTTHESNEEFRLQELTLKVTECRILDDWTTLDGLEKGRKLIAVRVEGSGDGEYEDYNRLAEPYLEADGHFRPMLSSYDFEPYARMYKTMPLLDETDLMLDETVDGWYAFVVEEDCSAVQICFEECEWEDWNKEELLEVHAVSLSLENETEGGTEHEAY